MTTASAGASTDAPTAAIFPSRSSTDPLRIAGPAAVRIVAFLMTVVREGNGVYVLGNGAAFGADRAPATRSGDDGEGDGACEPCAGAHARAAASRVNGAVRIVTRDLLKSTAGGRCGARSYRPSMRLREVTAPLRSP